MRNSSFPSVVSKANQQAKGESCAIAPYFKIIICFLAINVGPFMAIYTGLYLNTAQ